MLQSIKSELIKSRKTAANWLVLIGGFFIPLIFIVIQTFYPDDFSSKVFAPKYFAHLFVKNWESMAFLLLPVGVILATSLMAQLEYRNNTWKQVIASPQSNVQIYFSKLIVILIMMAKFFLLFTLGILLAAYLPPMLNGTGDFPNEAFPLKLYVTQTFLFFIACLPMVGLQYLVSLKFSNFLVAIGFGLGMVIAALFMIQWKHGFVFPYSYTMHQFSELRGNKMYPDHINIHLLSIGYFIVFVAAGYIIFIKQKLRG
ncbi:MAG: ABC transporter permease [Flavobacteriales bacterium]